jgi:hypothetical protein
MAATVAQLCARCFRGASNFSRIPQLINCVSNGCRVFIHRECSEEEISRADFNGRMLRGETIHFTCNKCHIPEQGIHFSFTFVFYVLLIAIFYTFVFCVLLIAIFNR